MVAKTKHPLYAAWRAACDRSSKGYAPACLRWRSSFDDFVSDVGDRPARQYTNVMLVHLDTFTEFGPGNFAWMDRSLMAAHLKKENHRHLMQEIRQPVPAYQPPERLLSAVEMDSKRHRRERQMLMETNHRRMGMEKLINHSPATRLSRHVVYKGERVSLKDLATQTGVDLRRLRDHTYRGRRTGDEAVAYILAHPHSPKKS